MRVYLRYFRLLVVCSRLKYRQWLIYAGDVGSGKQFWFQSVCWYQLNCTLRLCLGPFVGGFGDGWGRISRVCTLIIDLLLTGLMLKHDLIFRNSSCGIPIMPGWLCIVRFCLVGALLNTCYVFDHARDVRAWVLCTRRQLFSGLSTWRLRWWLSLAD